MSGGEPSIEDYMASLDQTIPIDCEDEVTPTPKQSPKRGRPRKQQQQEAGAPPPPPPTTSKKTDKEFEKKNEDMTRARLYKEICMYLENPVLSSKLPHIKANEKDTVDMLIEKRKLIKQALSAEFYRSVVYRTFEKSCQITENVMLAYLNRPEVCGFHKEVTQNLEDFDIELEEIAMDLQTMYQPPALLRLVMKMGLAMETVIERNTIGAAQLRNGGDKEIDEEAYSKVAKK